MKTNIARTGYFLLLSLSLSLIHFANAQAMSTTSSGSSPELLRFSISIPDQIQPEIARQDFENQSIFSFKEAGGKTDFLFSVNQVTDQQWLSIKDNIKNYSILENKDGLITFVQKTEQQSIRGKSNSAYQQVLQQVDSMIATVKM